MVISEELRRMPMLRLLIPFILGIVIQHSIQFDIGTIFPASAAFFFLLFIIALYRNLNSRYSYRWLYGFILNCFILFISMSIMGRTMQSNSIIDHTGKGGFIMARVLEFPNERENNTRLLVRPETAIIRDTIYRTSGKALLWFEKHSKASDLRPGDCIIIANNFREIRNRGNPLEFDYKSYLRTQGILGESFVNDEVWHLVDTLKSESLIYFPKTLRAGLLDKLDLFNITGREYAVAGALLLGYRGGLDQDLRNSYAASGAMHILAVSGLHVGILYIFLIWTLGFLKHLKYFLPVRMIIILFIIWIYAIVTGLSPSVTRAATMFSFLVLARSSKRNPNIYNTLASSAIIQLIADPFALFLAGFQLSYLAVAGIAFYQPRLYSLARLTNPHVRKLWALLTVSFSAQLLIFPLIIFYFNQFPAYFLLTNIIAIPLAIIILYTGMTFFIFSGVPLLSSGIVFILKNALLALNYMTEIISNLPNSQFTGIVISFPLMFIVYGIILSGTAYLVWKKPVWLLLAMALIFTGLILRAESKIKHTGQQFFIIYNSGNYPLYNFISGQNNIIISGREVDMKTTEVPYAASGIALNLKADKLDMFSLNEFISAKTFCESYPVKKSDSFVSFSGCRIYFATERNFYHIENLNPVQVDIAVISSGISNLDEILLIVSPEIIVFDPTVPVGRKVDMINQCRESGIRYHDVRISGAYTVKIN